jgi:hypothetical protein
MHGGLPMQLTELQPEFIRYEHTQKGIYHHTVATIADCQGISFCCPKCFTLYCGPVGTHRITCWSSSRDTPDEATPKPGRWLISGTGFTDLTLDCEPDASRSVRIVDGCKWHGYITNGLVTNA